MTEEFNLSEIFKERIRILELEAKENPKDKIVDIDLTFANPKKKIVGKALMNSVSRETYNYIVIKTIRECNKDVKEFIRLLKEVCEQEDYDVMIKDGEDGDITISFSEYIDKLAEANK